MSINKATAVYSVIIAVLVVLFLSFIPAYYFHLRVDIFGQYINHAKSFLQYKDLSQLGYNEYQPVAVMYFVLLSPALLLANQIQAYVGLVYISNIIFILAGAFLTYKYTKTYISVLSYSLIIIFTGPIVLHRFEMLVFLILLVSFYFIKNNKKELGYTFLGIATLTKIYPIIFAPYFFIKELKSSKPIKGILKYFAFYLLGILIVLFIFNILLNAEFSRIITDLKIHSNKPVHTESVFTSILTVVNKVQTGFYPISVGEWGIQGLKEPYIFLPKYFYNYFWIVATGVFYLAILLFKNNKKELDINILFTSILLFLVTSKILTAQYLLWFALLFPLFVVPKDKHNYNLWQLDLFLIITALFLGQIVYPLMYTEFLGEFFKLGTKQWLFYTIFARNIILTFILVIHLIQIFSNTDNATNNKKPTKIHTKNKK